MSESTATPPPAYLPKADQDKHRKTLEDYIKANENKNKGKPGHNPVVALRNLDVYTLRAKAEQGQLLKEDADAIGKLPKELVTDTPKIATPNK